MNYGTGPEMTLKPAQEGGTSTLWRLRGTSGDADTYATQVLPRLHDSILIMLAVLLSWWRRCLLGRRIVPAGTHFSYRFGRLAHCCYNWWSRARLTSSR